MTTNDELFQKLVLLHQEPLCQFKREFKFGMEEKLWQQKYRICFEVLEIQKTLCGGINIENLIDSTCFDQNVIKPTCFIKTLVKSTCFFEF